jgi:hypothetical protein
MTVISLKAKKPKKCKRRDFQILVKIGQRISMSVGTETVLFLKRAQKWSVGGSGSLFFGFGRGKRVSGARFSVGGHMKRMTGAVMGSGGGNQKVNAMIQKFAELRKGHARNQLLQLCRKELQARDFTKLAYLLEYGHRVMSEQ